MSIASVRKRTGKAEVARAGTNGSVGVVAESTVAHHQSKRNVSSPGSVPSFRPFMLRESHAARTLDFVDGHLPRKERVPCKNRLTLKKSGQERSSGPGSCETIM